MAKEAHTQNYSMPWRNEELIEDINVSKAANRNPGGGNASTLPQSTTRRDQMVGQHHHCSRTQTVPRGAWYTGRSRRGIPSAPVKAVLTLAILTGLMFSCLDTSIISTALINISIDLNNDYLNAPWAILAYLLTYMAFSVGFSKLSDIYGRLNMLILSWVLFSGFSIGCALSQDMLQLIVNRAFQGIGGAGLYSLTQTCLVELGFSKPEIIGALIGLTLSISYVLGPVLGGAITSSWNWRGIFIINIPFGIVCIFVLYCMWPHEEERHSWSSRAAVAKIDFLGNILLVGASVLLVFAMQQGGSLVLPWGSPTIVCSLTFAILCWIGLAVWEFWIYRPNSKVEPIFPLRLARRRAYMSCLHTTFLTGWSYITLVVDIPERFQILHGDSSLQAGIQLFPLLGFCSIGSFVASLISKKRNYTGPTIVFGMGIQFTGLALLFGSESYSTLSSTMLWHTAVYGFGVGLCFAAATMLTTVEAKGKKDLAVAQGGISQARVFGGCLGLTVASMVFNRNVQRDLTRVLTSEQLDSIHRTPMAVFSFPGDLQPLVKAVYVDALKSQMLSLLVVAGLGCLISFGTLMADPTPVSEMLSRPKEPSARASDVELGNLEGGRAVSTTTTTHAQC